MQLRQASLSDGYIWFRQGLGLLQRNTATLLLLVFTYLLFSQLIVLLPVIGVIALLILTPIIFLIFMGACRALTHGVSLQPGLLINTYRTLELRVKRRLLWLGVVYMVAVLCVSWGVTNFVDVQMLAPLMLQQQVPTAAMIEQLYWAIGIGALLYFPVAVLMWFAPLLVAWQNMTIVQSLFFSYLACWRNRAAFIVYLSILGVAVVLVPWGLEVILAQFGLVRFAVFLIAPYAMLLLAVLYCSAYASWEGCFQDNSTPE